MACPSLTLIQRNALSRQIRGGWKSPVYLWIGIVKEAAASASTLRSPQRRLSQIGGSSSSGLAGNMSMPSLCVLFLSQNILVISFKLHCAWQASTCSNVPVIRTKHLFEPNRSEAL